jgi:chorismate-pyruvate lyase
MMLSWLLTRGLLTSRIRQAAGDGFAMNCLLEARLGAEHVREVSMSCYGVVWMFAHTRIPLDLLNFHPWLGKVGKSTLGEVLSARRDVKRRDFRYAKLHQDSWLTGRVSRQVRMPSQSLWARHSEFVIEKLSFDLYEIFMPAIGRREPKRIGDDV